MLISTVELGKPDKIKIDKWKIYYIYLTEKEKENGKESE